jgi:hypothetical protein
VLKKIDAHEVIVSDVQKVLLDAGCQLFPYKDVWNSDPLFIPTQSLALIGIFVDDEDWAFNADKSVSEEELQKYLSSISDDKIQNKLISLAGKTRREVFKELYSALFNIK